jgi:hypothetical protein
VSRDDRSAMRRFRAIRPGNAVMNRAELDADSQSMSS